MDVIRDWRAVPERFRGAHVAIGNFDGVHRGHQAVLAQCRADAAVRNAPAGALLFEPHPRAFFAPDKPFFRLTPLPLKLRLFGLLGLDFALVVPFDAGFAALTAEAFVREVIAGGLRAAQVIVGYDFYFGKGRQGSPADLVTAGGPFGFSVSVVQPVKDAAQGEPFSSSRARALLSRGSVGEAAEILGYRWRVRGRVGSGAGRGTALGFPTANLVLESGQTLRPGIYAVRVEEGDTRHDAIAYFGSSPTFGDGTPALEVMLFDFAGDLYGREIEVAFVAFLRADAAFPDASALQAQMDRDCADAREVLRRLAETDPMRAFPLGRALDDAG